ncbi:hypothetical protein ACFL0I_00105 [Gemmatimonadota bacterium]
MQARSLVVLVAALSVAFPHPLHSQGGADPVILRYKAQPQTLHYEVTIGTEYRDVARTGATGRWDATYIVYDDVGLEVREGETGNLLGTYDLGFVQSWSRVSGMQRGTERVPVSRGIRNTGFEMTGTGDVGGMGGGIRALSGEEIFRRLWEVPHVLPEGPVEVGTTWTADRSVFMSYSHSTEIEARYEVVEVIGEDVWVEFSGSVIEFLMGARSGETNHGTFFGRFGFRPSLGAMVGVEWDFDHQRGNPDRPWEYREALEEGAIVLLGLAEELPVREVTRLIQEDRAGSTAVLFWILGAVVVVTLAIAGGGG